jgi:hypothetical protein
MAIFTPEEQKYIEKAINHYGAIRCMDVPVDRIVRIGKLLSLSPRIEAFQGGHSLIVSR